MIECINVVSESSLVRAYLGDSLSGHGERIEAIGRPDRLSDGAVGPAEIVVWEVSDSEDCCEILAEREERGLPIDRFILLLRDRDQALDLRGFVREVGAILAPDTSVDVLKGILYPVSQGICVLPRDLLRDVYLPQPAFALPQGAPHRLTKREKAILRRLSVGSCNKTIASEMNITDGTVRVHVRSILRKTGARNRTEAALFAGHGAGALSPHR